MKTELCLGAFLLLTMISTQTQGSTGAASNDLNSESNKLTQNNGNSFRKRIKRWQCDTGFGGGGGGGHNFGLGGNNFGDGLAAGGSLLGAWGGGSNLNDMDPTTYILLALLSGAGTAVSPIPVGSPAASPELARLIPLPPSAPLKSPTTETPPTKAVIEDFNDELSYGLRPPQAAPITAMADPDPEEKKARGHVTPGNRCEDDSECVAHAECVEALRQKYCVCSPGRRPKGGVCV